MTLWLPGRSALQSPFARNLEYSSIQLPCWPFGVMEIVSGGFLPTSPASLVWASASAWEFSAAGPLLM